MDPMALMENPRKEFDRVHGENGTITLEEFKEMLTKSKPGEDTDKIAEHVFRLFDKNKDGTIDKEEFFVIHAMMMGDDEDEDAMFKSLFSVFDVDGNKTITQEELGHLIKDMFTLLKPEDDVTLSLDAIVTHAFREMDKDRDNKVTFEEFKDALMNVKKYTGIFSMKIMDVISKQIGF